MKEINTIGIDLAKRNMRVVGMNGAGKVVLRRWVYRSELLEFMAKLKPCLVGMEACSGSHHWAREIGKFGHEVKLMPPQYVKPYVKSNKNDTNDAEACAEAVRRPTMRFVAVKSEQQQRILQVHRVRARLIKSRTALSNEIRGLLAEFGVVLSCGIGKLREEIVEALDKYSERLGTETCELMKRLSLELVQQGEEIAHYDEQIKRLHKELPESEKLTRIPGIGKISATALIGLFGGPDQFRNGRQFAAFLGLVPRQYSTGGKSHLGRISKRGDTYMRQLLIQGAQSVLRHLGKKQDPYSRWARTLCERRGWCRTAVAIANKNARIAWNVLARGANFEVGHVPLRAAA
jgi:transposase